MSCQLVGNALLQQKIDIRCKFKQVRTVDVAIRKQLDDSTCDRICSKVEEGHSVTKVAQQFWIDKNVISRVEKPFKPYAQL